MSDDRVIVGTEAGRLLLMESGELKTEFNLTNDDCMEERFVKFACCLIGIFGFVGQYFVCFLQFFSKFLVALIFSNS